MTRNAPVQSRSAERVAQLRQAARDAIATIGIERFTTADVARISGSSIGTVYRYFVDRVAVLDDLYPNRITVLEPTEEDPNKLKAALEAALAVLNDTALQNPRDKVRQSRDIIESALGLNAELAE